MDNQWKEEKCGTCDFVTEWLDNRAAWLEKEKDKQVLDEDLEGRCRQNPPSVSGTVNYSRKILRMNDEYPVIKKDTCACSYWREK